MKKNLFSFRKAFLGSLFLVLVPFLGNAQSLTLTGTNAASHSYNSATYTHTITIPFFATSLTGNFKINKDGVFSTCTPGNQRVVQFNSYPSGAFMGSNGTTNTTYANLNVTSLPIGTTQLIMRFGCSNTPLSQILVKIIVNRLPDPQLNFTITPYCKTNSNGVYTNYFGYHVSGTASNRSGLQFKVGHPSGPVCTSVPTIIPFNGFVYNTNTFTPNSSFYDCNSGGVYTVKLEYRYQTTENVYITQPIADNTYGWHEHTWTKTALVCLPLLDPVPGDLETGKIAEQSETKDKKYRIYPNPTNGEIHLESINKETVIKSVKIFDSNNILVVNKRVKAENLEAFDLSALRPGIYFVNIETNEGVFVEKVVLN